MTRNEHLGFCEKCTNRNFDFKQGIICNITNKIADFEESCLNFNLDDTVKGTLNENEELVDGSPTIKLDEALIHKLRGYQDFYYAFNGGLLAALISAVLWAIITVATQYQIGYMAIGVGLLVGFTVQFFGAGVDKKFGYLGAAFSLLGCLLGNLLSQVGFLAKEQSLSYFEMLTYLNFSLIYSILLETFNPIDILFYGIAVFEGYKFAFRKITNELLENLKQNNSDGNPPYSKLRMPFAIGSIIVLALVFYKISLGVSGFKTYSDDSGKKISEGELQNSKEHGKWIYYYENGNTKSVGFYNMGLQDSLWQWYSEAGQVKRIGNYKNGLEHGVWINYYDNGLISDSGTYIEGRMHGFWINKFENGNISQTGFFNRNVQDSIWTVFFENGQLSSIGKIKEGKPIGNWTTYFKNGQLSEEITHHEKDIALIQNVYDIGGNQLVINENGRYKSFASNGHVMLSGTIENGLKVGKWYAFYENGKQKEEGLFKNGTYQILNCWDFNEKQIIKDGFGIFTSYYLIDTSIFETGEIKNGLKHGIWKNYHESNGNTLQELQYMNGKLTGMQTYYFESGQIYSKGEMIDDLREGEWSWYYENGNISSTVKFNKGKKEGIQIMYSETGEKVKEEFYKNGELIDEKQN